MGGPDPKALSDARARLSALAAAIEKLGARGRATSVLPNDAVALRLLLTDHARLSQPSEGVKARH